MIKLTTGHLQELLQQSENIRNVSIIGNTNHGKSTLVNLLAQEVGIASSTGAEDVSFASVHKEQQKNGPTTQLALTPLHVDISENQDTRNLLIGTDKFLINIIDSPGHSELANEVTTALRVSDGTVIVVCCMEGPNIQTETLLRIALNECIKPVILINKVDCAFLKPQTSNEQIYQSFARTIQSINETIATHASSALGDTQLYPSQGTVAFGSGCDGWAFTVRTFSRRYAKKFGVDEDKMSRRLWGDHYFIPGQKKWSSRTDGTERAFNVFILSVYRKLMDALLKGERNDLLALASKLEVKLTENEKEKYGKELFQIMMQRFLPATDTLMEMIVLHLPSPLAAQKYRAEFLYEGPPTDVAYNAVRDCDPKADVMLFVSNTIALQTPKGQRYYALGRVFSGTVRSGDNLIFHQPHDRYSRPAKSSIKKISQIVLILGQATESIESVPAGNIIGVAGIDQFLLKSGTITSDKTAYSIRMMRPSTSPVVKCHVDVGNPSDLPKLLEGLKHISRFGLSVKLDMNESGDHFVAGPGEYHLNVSLKELEQNTNIPLQISNPTVQYRETVSRQSAMTALSKSPNKHLRFFVTANPLNSSVAEAIERGEISCNDNFENRARILTDKYKWNANDARKIWSFGYDDSSIPNILVDQTKNLQYLNEIKDSFVSGFVWAIKSGPIAEEPVSSVRFNIVDVAMLSDAIHRGGGQVIPAARRVIYAATLLAEPKLLEPVNRLEIRIPQQATMYDAVFDVISQQRGHVLEAVSLDYSSSMVINAYLPVMESFDFKVALNRATEGQVSLTSVFDRWQALPDSPLDQTTGAGQIAADLRRQKGLKEQVPTFEAYYDKL